MIFNSFEFLLFFPAVVILYFLFPHRYRWILLLLASYYFYAAWKAEYLILIIFSTLIDYWAGLQMGKRDSPAERRPYLVLSLLSNLGLLFAFKYFNFFNESLRAVFDSLNIFYGVPAFEVLLPVGISFYTFQTLAYSIDVYRGKKEPEKHLGIFALYVSFFPQLVAGPIERSQHLLPQFRERYSFDYDRVTDGLKLMLWGFFKKIVIADRLALYVNEVYNNPGDYQGVTILVATYFFAFQIFCDFSAYTDIARGAAKVMGYDLMENFRRPYFAKSVAEFWQRWHISLSTWFRDYLYIPLGGNRTSRWRWQVNIFIVFLVSGLWHGANWTFVIWGALHGTYMLVEIMTLAWRDRFWTFLEARLGHTGVSKAVADVGIARFPSIGAFRRAIAVFATFHLVVFAWIFFRASTLSDATLLIKNIFRAETSWSVVLLNNVGFGVYTTFLSVAALALLIIVELIGRKQNILMWIRTKPLWSRWIIYYSLLLAIILFGEFNQQQFIYFQF